MLLHGETTICTTLILTFETLHWGRGEKSSVDCSGSRDEMKRGEKNDTTTGEGGDKKILLDIFGGVADDI